MLHKTAVRAAKFLPPAFKQPELKIWFQEIFNISLSPTIIYQMGKVGSETVLDSLRSARLAKLNTIYHVHFLSHEGIQGAEEYFSSLNSPIPEHVQDSKKLRAHLDKAKGIKWRVITLVREPISRDISDVFQNIKYCYPQLLDEQEDLKMDDLFAFLRDLFLKYNEETDYACTWFDREMKQTFNIDVYAYPFEHAKGYTIIRTKNVDLLILRLEELSATFKNAFQEFLRLRTPFQMIRSKGRKNREYGQEYSDLLQRFSLPSSVCRKIYSSKYATHFYPEAMRAEFIRKWSENANNSP